MTPAEKKAETGREVERELSKKRRELGEEEQDRRVKERMRLCQEKTLKDAEETRERDRREAQAKLDRMERLELGEEEEIAVVEDNDFVIKGPSQEEMEAIRTSGWGGPTTNFKDVRIKDAQREFDASSAVRKVIMSSERVAGAEGGMVVSAVDEKEGERIKGKEGENGTKQGKEKEEDECTPYEEDSEEEEEEEKKEIKNKEVEVEMESESEEEDAGKWGDALRDIYEGTGFSIEEDAETVAQYASEGGFDVASSSHNVKMVADLIRKLRNFREGREREEEGESDKEEERKEETESRRERKKEKETDRKNRSKSRKDISVERRSKRPPSRPSRQVRESSSAMEDE